MEPTRQGAYSVDQAGLYLLFAQIVQEAFGLQERKGAAEMHEKSPAQAEDKWRYRSISGVVRRNLRRNGQRGILNGRIGEVQSRGGVVIPLLIRLPDFHHHLSEPGHDGSGAKVPEVRHSVARNGHLSWPIVTVISRRAACLRWILRRYSRPGARNAVLPVMARLDAALASDCPAIAREMFVFLAISSTSLTA